ncbi:Transmembrane protein [Halotydeus destructor]|nr:Transmembrane protein [Halotydeus destructor]
MFSEFRKYIAPTYYHDRCERTLHMHLYTMHKREILLTLAGFLSTFVLLLFIGLAGPNVTKLDVTQASEIFKTNHINMSTGSEILYKGPFVLITPTMSTYSQHLCLYVTFYLKNEEASETFHKDFVIALKIKAIEDEKSGKSVDILSEDLELGGGRLHHLYCSVKKCDPIQTFHLEFLEYQSYEFEVTFKGLESVHAKYVLNDIKFTFQSINTSFTTLTIWFRFVFLAAAFVITCWFTHSMHRFPYNDWSMEQKWIASLLPLLILYNNPFYPMIFLFGSSLPRLIEIIFQTTFYTCVMFFWVAFFHGIRQTNRSLSKFYAPKLVLLVTFWFTVTYVTSWSRIEKLEKPTLDEEAAFAGNGTLRLSSMLFYVSFISYLVYLVLLILAAFTELLAMPYFDLRLKLQGFLISFTVTIAVLVVIVSSPAPASVGLSSVSAEDENEIPKIPFLQLLPWTYDSSSSAAFLALFSISNLYIFFCAYFYYPSTASMMDTRIIRDNPTLSMMNDSDEEVIFGSDTEEPLHHPKLIDTPDDGEESD